MTKPKFFMDTHINSTAVKQLRLKGLDVVRCEEVGLAKAEDTVLLAYAVQQGRVMVSCDHHFEQHHYDYLANEQHHCGIIFMKESDHCKHLSEIVRIVLYYYELADTAEDLYNELWLGKNAQ